MIPFEAIKGHHKHGVYRTWCLRLPFLAIATIQTAVALLRPEPSCSENGYSTGNLAENDHDGVHRGRSQAQTASNFMILAARCQQQANWHAAASLRGRRPASPGRRRGVQRQRTDANLAGESIAARCLPYLSFFVRVPAALYLTLLQHPSLCGALAAGGLQPSGAPASRNASILG